MTFIFWQNIVSIHQRAFLEALAAQNTESDVILVAENEINEARTKMGWQATVPAGVAAHVKPSYNTISTIIATHTDAVHIFGGINTGPLLALAFKLCMKANGRIGIMTEPYNAAGWRGLLRQLKYTSYRMRYQKHIDFILAIGKEGEMQSQRLGYNNSIIFPWAYFIDKPGAYDTGAQRIPNSLIYAGRLEPQKGIADFLRKLLNTADVPMHIDIFGDGPDKVAINQLIHNQSKHKVTVHPFIPHIELQQLWNRYEWVALPSMGKDGWGAIVSEGLLNGAKAICSTKCGASRVVKPGWNGQTFNWNTNGSCEQAIQAMFEADSYATPSQIENWANKSLTGTAGAYYFSAIIANIYNNQPRPSTPWETI